MVEKMPEKKKSPVSAYLHDPISPEEAARRDMERIERVDVDLGGLKNEVWTIGKSHPEWESEVKDLLDAMEALRAKMGGKS